MSKFATATHEREKKMSDSEGKGQIRTLHGFELGFNANAVSKWWMLNFFDEKNSE